MRNLSSFELFSKEAVQLGAVSPQGYIWQCLQPFFTGRTEEWSQAGWYTSLNTQDCFPQKELSGSICQQCWIWEILLYCYCYCHFYLAGFSIFCVVVYSFQKFDYTMCKHNFFVYLVWYSLSFLNFLIYIFHQFENLVIISSNIFSVLCLFPFSLTPMA